MIFNERLKELRKTNNNMSQAKLAEQIGYRSTAISNYENGRNLPSIDDLCKISDVFNVTLDYLIGRTDIREVPVFSETHKKLFDIFNDLNETNQHTIITQAKWLQLQQGPEVVSPKEEKNSFVDPFMGEVKPKEATTLKVAQDKKNPFDDM